MTLEWLEFAFLATKEHSHQIPILPLLTDSKPVFLFVMDHNSMTVNCGTRERTCATNTICSTHWQLLFLVLFVDVTTTTVRETLSSKLHRVIHSVSSPTHSLISLFFGSFCMQSWKLCLLHRCKFKQLKVKQVIKFRVLIGQPSKSFIWLVEI